MIARQYGPNFTVIAGGEFVVLQQPRNVALRTLVARGLSESVAETVLDRKVPDSEWRAAHASAAAATAKACELALEGVAATTDLEHVRAEVDELKAKLEARRLEAERKEKIERLEAHQESEFQRLCERFESEGGSLTLGVRRTFKAHLAGTREGRMLAELRGAA